MIKIAVIECRERKPYKVPGWPEVRILKFPVAGYSDAIRTLKEFRKVSKSKLRLLKSIDG